MSIKSQRAKEFIQNKLTDACDPRFVGHRYAMMLGKNNAFKAVKIAESDARERAGMAYCNSLGAHTGVKCPTLLECECIYLENFLKHYDNE